MRAFLLTLCLTYSLFSFAQVPSADPIASGAIAISGSIAKINVSRVFKYGVGIKYGTSGTVTAGTASLQGSMDGVNFFPFPLKGTGDVTTSGALVTSTTSSGMLYLERDDLAVNWVQVFYNPGTAGATINIQQISKVHGANY